MKALKGLLAAGVLATAAASQASNFSYTYVEAGLGQMWLDEEIFFDGYAYEDFGLATLSGSYQFGDNFALQLTSSGIANEQGDTEITQSQVSLSASYPVAVGPRLDLAPVVGVLSADAEFCDHSYYYGCFSEEDSGLLYGVGGRYWAVREELELNAAVSDSSLDGAETAFRLGAAYWFHSRHSIRVNLAGSSSSSSLTFGYAFAWR